MKKTLVVGLALGLVSLVAATSYANDPRPDEVKYGDLPAQGCSQGWDCKDQKNWGGEGIIGSSHDMTNVAKTLSLPLHTSAGGSGTTSSRGSGATANNTGHEVGEDAQNRICVYCHHPHNAIIAAGQSGSAANAPAYSPLWNRLAGNAAGRVYTGYNNGIMMSDTSITGTDKRHVLNANTVGGGTHIKGVTLLCMSCHDGVTAMNAYSTTNPSGSTGSSANTGKNTATAINPNLTSSFDTDMNNHHPMGFSYRAVQTADQEIAPVETVMVPRTQVEISSLLYGSGPDATMECVTCHDVHNTANQPGAERFLWRSDNNSNFCLTCHLK